MEIQCSASSSCKHPWFIAKVCANCGAAKNDNSMKTIPLSYWLDDLEFSLEERDRVRSQDLEQLISTKKLRLVLDLDHTLLHALGIYNLTPEEKEYLLCNNKQPIQHDCFGEGKLYNLRGLIVKLRPYIRTFLQKASAMFELCIYTMGDRTYANIVKPILDPEGLYFGNHNVITGDDCTIPGRKGLDVLLSYERVTVVVDDTEAVWELHRRNLINIAAYRYFADVPHCRRMRLKPCWSDFKLDENEQCGELARILKTLQKIHRKFYETKEDLRQRDVRSIMDGLRKKSPKLFKISPSPGSDKRWDNKRCGNLISMFRGSSLACR